MLLRLFLVGAVASLGFDLPTGNDVQAWTRASQAWWDATTAEWLLPSIDLTPKVANQTKEPPDQAVATLESIVEMTPSTIDEPSAPIAGTLTDQVFDGVVTRMVSTFAADPTPLPAVAARKTPSFEPVEVVDDLYSDLAYELNRASEEAPFPAQPVTLAALAPTLGQTESVTPSTGKRLATAVRLTSQAMSAWAGLLRPDVTIDSACE